MLCFNHVNKDGNLLDFNLTFRNNELVWISYDQKETKDALYELLSGTEVFEGKVIIPKGQIRLHVQTGLETVEVDFIIVDAYSPYTAIVARP